MLDSSIYFFDFDLNILRSYNIYRVHLALSLDGLLASAIPVGELAKLSVPIYAYYKTISTGDIRKQYLGSVDLIYLEILEATHKLAHDCTASPARFVPHRNVHNPNKCDAIPAAASEVNKCCPPHRALLGPGVRDSTVTCLHRGAAASRAPSASSCCPCSAP